ncbi:periplasmic heavy metal sensor [Yoonia litorea]|uniref:Uncharacterized membrane protein n=1 Tax=Yoonia litorea TaxID=1123755 RepID=A0A1I6LG84_9RHOB|nr:periplasmic heavy metal sensor [Yoonia litorea]SFS02452.1 Uncharacterized membrane protein [Yoonia litorea]
MDDQKAEGRQPRRLWRVLLVVSLALNLVVVGIIAGALFSGRFHDRPPRSFDLGLGPIARALTVQERRDIGRSLREMRPLRDLNRQDLAEDLAAVLLAEPFAPEALRLLLAEQSDQVAQVQVRARDAFIDAIVAMSPERRAAFADDLSRQIREGRPRHAVPSGG